MAKKTDYSTPPETLDGHIFYGLTLDEEQRKFRDELWNSQRLVVSCASPAGCGKTFIAIAVGLLACRYGLYDKLVYCVNPTQENQIGFRPGSTDEKLHDYAIPLYDALITLGENPEALILSDASPIALRNGAFIEFTSPVFKRGCNFERSYVIIDEAQNTVETVLRKLMTRAHDTSKVILLGNPPQCDLPNPALSAMTKCMAHYADKRDPRYVECMLTKNYRGWIATTGDEPWSES